MLLVLNFINLYFLANLTLFIKNRIAKSNHANPTILLFKLL